MSKIVACVALLLVAGHLAVGGELNDSELNSIGSSLGETLFKWLTGTGLRKALGSRPIDFGPFNRTIQRSGGSPLSEVSTAGGWITSVRDITADQDSISEKVVNGENVFSGSVSFWNVEMSLEPLSIEGGGVTKQLRANMSIAEATFEIEVSLRESDCRLSLKRVRHAGSVGIVLGLENDENDSVGEGKLNVTAGAMDSFQEGIETELVARLRTVYPDGAQKFNYPDCQLLYLKREPKRGRV